MQDQRLNEWNLGVIEGMSSSAFEEHSGPFYYPPSCFLGEAIRLFCGILGRFACQTYQVKMKRPSNMPWIGTSSVSC